MLKIQIQTPFNIITIIMEAAIQRINIIIVNITYFLGAVELFVLVSFFQIIVGKITIITKITTHNIS